MGLEWKQIGIHVKPVAVSRTAPTRFPHRSTVAAMLAAAAGGAYTGYFSSGASAWLSPMILLSVGMIALIDVVLSFRLHWIRKEAGLWQNGVRLFGVLFSYTVTQAVVAPIYPSPPESCQECFQGVLWTLQFGPC